jgi:PAS domain S-box-containing protein
MNNKLPNILIVDDSEINLIFLETVISEIKVNLIQAHSGEEALKKTIQVELALAIIDVRMPGMNGYDLALRLNEVRYAEKVPIIFLTASHIDEIEIFKGYGSGAVDYLFKPVDINVLRSKIHVFLDLYNQKITINEKVKQLKQTAKELSRVNTALKTSEEKYRSYVDNAPDGVLVTDEDGNNLEVNDAACNITGFPKEVFLKMSILDILPDFSFLDGHEHFINASKFGASKVDLQFKFKNETLRWCVIETVKLSNIRLIHFLKDITHRKDIEEDLELKKNSLENRNHKISQALCDAKILTKKYSELYNFAPSGYFTISEDTAIQELNISGARMLGLDRSQLIDCKFSSFVSINTLPVFKAFYKRVFKSKAKEMCEIMLEINGNQTIFVFIEGMFVRLSNQCLINVVDITERKLSEQALKISEEKYKTIMNASPDGILLIDLKGIITEISEIGLEIFDAHSRQDMIGKEFYRFVSSEEKKTIKETVEKTMNEGLAQNIEMKIKKINLAPFDSEISVTLIQDQYGEPISFMVIIRDISQRKKIETKQYHADRMASLGEMATGIAHEINQPLNIISMVMDKILFESDNKGFIDIDFIKKKSAKIFGNIYRIRNIIEHIRAFSSNHNDDIRSTFIINTSIENAVSMITEQFKHLGIKLDLQLGKHIPKILGNTYKFEQVIINLLTNAKDALIEKQNKSEEIIELIVGIRSYEENQYLIVEVTDNGIGIKNEDISNVLLPFYTTKDVGHGTGIGLSICYQIIKEMNGTIEITSNYSAGTKIKLILDNPKELEKNGN